jgi:TrmH family RNA methyltransferase
MDSEARRPPVDGGTSHRFIRFDEVVGDVALRPRLGLKALGEIIDHHRPLFFIGLFPNDFEEHAEAREHFFRSVLNGVDDRCLQLLFIVVGDVMLDRTAYIDVHRIILLSKARGVRDQPRAVLTLTLSKGSIGRYNEIYVKHDQAKARFEPLRQIESPQNRHFKEWKKLLRRKGREKAGLYLVEGEHLVAEALKEKGVVKALIFDASRTPPELPGAEDVAAFSLSAPLFKELCATEAPQGVLAVCAVTDDKLPEDARRFLLIDAVRDPGNLGTLIRTADAAGLDAVILGPGTVDPYNDKVLRSAQGSHFHLPVRSAPLSEIIPALQARGIPVYGTSLAGADLGGWGPVEAFALLVGNEADGVDPVLLAMTDANVRIPMYGRAESLNVAVAAGILMYHFRGLSSR